MLHVEKPGKKKMATVARMDGKNGKKEPLWIFYDSEAANGNVYYGDIIEIAAKCHPGIVKGEFRSLINTNQELGSFALNESGFTKRDLIGQLPLKEVLKKFLAWIAAMVRLAGTRNNGTRYFPVLCAHNSFGFDCQILLGNMERLGLNYNMLEQHNLHFADSFIFCKKLKERGDALFANVRLSLDALFTKFFPTEKFKGRHRAMGDVEAMVKIFTQTPLIKQFHHMPISTTAERVKYYCSQSSAKVQQFILEEKLAKLDACSRNMSVKRLLRDGITYDHLKVIFERSASFLEFFQNLKDRGIERKVAKVIALQLGGLGLQNQGYQENVSDGLDATSKEDDAGEVVNIRSLNNVSNGCVSEAELSKDTQNEPQMNKPREASFNVNGEECVECWDEEIEESGSGDKFVLRFSKSIPISVMQHDIYHSSNRKIKDGKSINSENKTEALDFESELKDQEKSKEILKEQADSNISSSQGKGDICAVNGKGPVVVTVFIGDIAIQVPCKEIPTPNESTAVRNLSKHVEAKVSPHGINSTVDVSKMHTTKMAGHRVPSNEIAGSIEQSNESDNQSADQSHAEAQDQSNGHSARSCGGTCKEYFTSYADFSDVPTNERQTFRNQEEQPIGCHVNNTIDNNIVSDHPDEENVNSQSSELTHEQVRDNKVVTDRSNNLIDTRDITEVNVGNDGLVVEQCSDGEGSIHSSITAEVETHLGEQYVSEEPNCNVITRDELYSDVSFPPGYLEFPQGCNGTVPQTLEYYGQPYMSYNSPWSIPHYPAQAPKHMLPPVQYHSPPPPPGFVPPHMAHPLPVMHPQTMKFHGKHFLPPGLSPLGVQSQVPMFGQPRTRIPMFHPFSGLVHTDRYSCRPFGESRHDTYRPPQSSYNTTLKSFDNSSSPSSSQGTDARLSPLSDEESFTRTVSQNRDLDLMATTSVDTANKHSLISHSSHAREAVATSSSGFQEESVIPVVSSSSDLLVGVDNCCNSLSELGDVHVADTSLRQAREDGKNAVTTFKDASKNLNDRKGISKIDMTECFNREACFRDKSFGRKCDTKFTKLSKKERSPKTVAENGFTCSVIAETDFRSSSSNITRTVEKSSEVRPGSPNVTSAVSKSVKRTERQLQSTGKQSIPKQHDKGATSTSKTSSKPCSVKDFDKSSARKHTVRFADQLRPFSLKETREETSNNKDGHVRCDFGIQSDIQRVNPVSQNNSGEANHSQKRQGILKNSPPKDESESRSVESKKQTAKMKRGRRYGSQSMKAVSEVGNLPSGVEKTQENGKGVSGLHVGEPRKNNSAGNPSNSRRSRPFIIHLLKPPQEMPRNSTETRGQGRFKDGVKPDKNNNDGKISKIVSA